MSTFREAAADQRHGGDKIVFRQLEVSISTSVDSKYWTIGSKHHKVEHSLVCVEGPGRISRSGLTQDIKMGSCVFQCDVPHQ